MSLRPILYAEDEENDVFFLERAFTKTGIPNPLVTVRDGQEAIDYCLGLGRYANRVEHPLPCMMLLDLNMPKKSGLEALKCIREQPSFRALPIIVLTSSLHESDINLAYIHGANAYLGKPSQPEGLIFIVKAIQDFWLTLNCIPQQGPERSDEAAQAH